MKKLLKILLSLGVLAFFISGCEDDSEVTVLKEIDFPKEVTTSKDSVNLTEANQESDVLTIEWQAADYHFDAPVTYTLEFTLPSDTASWTSAISREIGEDVLAVSMIGTDLNDMALNLGLQPDQMAPMAIRVKSFVDRPAYSESVTVKVSPYSAYSGYLWVPGEYQEWNPSTAPKIRYENEAETVFKGYVYMRSEGPFKFTSYPDWNHTSFGYAGDTLLAKDPDAENLMADTAGHYEFVVDTANLVWHSTYIESWGIIGTATDGGWTQSTPMNYNEESDTWSVTTDLASGALKFRANNEWEINYGPEDTNELSGILINTDASITIPEAGNYTVTIDLSRDEEPFEYTYEVTKN